MNFQKPNEILDFDLIEFDLVEFEFKYGAEFGNKYILNKNICQTPV